ncbi:hypothetical protein HLASF_1140 [Halanaeroarchaeum sulfurireducens]|uniref:Uncharacterized protein n=1 Tax=Halanaeroarchaeum sulfurireducens TaxID=1604004 RepID=A0A0F7PE63_9EURY|nr:hypothetical protein HLASF_1140 [Halanaeroarchaeum sulfurireducens]ALG82024.1 hypothetical protein HLASA_1129 [Halanaeroarchaeum sulfurireducens]
MFRCLRVPETVHDCGTAVLSSGEASCICCRCVHVTGAVRFLDDCITVVPDKTTNLLGSTRHIHTAEAVFYRSISFVIPYQSTYSFTINTIDLACGVAVCDQSVVSARQCTSHLVSGDIYVRHSDLRHFSA